MKSASYHPHGAMSEMELGNGVKEICAFNSRLRPTSIAAEATSSQVTLPSPVNTYAATNDNGNVLTQTAKSGEETGWSRSCSYAGDGTTGQYGNLKLTGTEVEMSLNCGIYSAAKNPCAASGYNYDAAGNLISYTSRALEYDAENRKRSLRNWAVRRLQPLVLLAGLGFAGHPLCGADVSGEVVESALVEHLGFAGGLGFQ